MYEKKLAEQKDDGMNPLQSVGKLTEAYYDFWFRINELYRLRAAVRRVNENTLFLLDILDRKGPCAQNEIAAKLFLPKQTVSLGLSALEKKGCVRRLRPPEGDGRSKIVSLTDAGRAYSGTILGALRREEEAAFSRMPPQQLGVTVNVFSLMADLLPERFSGRGKKAEEDGTCGGETAAQ